MTLVAATPAHAAAMALLHAASFAPPARWGADAFELQLALPGVFGWIDPAGGMILTRCIADEAEVLTLAVDPAARRRGVGRILLQRAMATAQDRGAEAVYLEVAADNAPARALYDGLGFVLVGRRARYYAGGIDALVLRRRFAEATSS